MGRWLLWLCGIMVYAVYGSIVLLWFVGYMVNMACGYMISGSMCVSLLLCMDRMVLSVDVIRFVFIVFVWFIVFMGLWCCVFRLYGLNYVSLLFTVLSFIVVWFMNLMLHGTMGLCCMVS